MPKDHISLYLNSYAEGVTAAIAEAIPHELQFEHVVIIPAYNESVDCIKRLQSSTIIRSHATLIILVINQNEKGPPNDNNQKLWEYSLNTGQIHLSNEKFHCIQWHNSSSCLLALNHFCLGRSLSSKQGVGLARKIGCDLACHLIAKGQINSGWLHSTDADVCLPDDYLQQTPQGEPYPAAVYSFKHVPSSEEKNPAIHKATQLYEQAIGYYVDGLAYAASPYAYHCLGSCITVSAKAYAQVRGFPKRAAGEDFYLLNKLRKLGEIKQLEGKALEIESRLSQRAPFGTGPAVENIITQRYSADNYLYYHPDIFTELKILLKQFEDLFEQRRHLAQWLDTLSPPSQKALETLGISTLFEHLDKHCSNKQDATKQILNWFDGFKTLKFIHLLERWYPKVPLMEGIKKLSLNL